MPGSSPKEHCEEIMRMNCEGLNMYKEVLQQKEAELAELKKQLAEVQGYDMIGS